MAFGYKAILAQHNMACDVAWCGQYIRRRTMVWYSSDYRHTICHKCYTDIGQRNRRIK